VDGYVRRGRGRRPLVAETFPVDDLLAAPRHVDRDRLTIVQTVHTRDDGIKLLLRAAQRNGSARLDLLQVLFKPLLAHLKLTGKHLRQEERAPVVTPRDVDRSVARDAPVEPMVVAKPCEAGFGAPPELSEAPARGSEKVADEYPDLLCSTPGRPARAGLVRLLRQHPHRRYIEHHPPLR